MPETIQEEIAEASDDDQALIKILIQDPNEVKKLAAKNRLGVIMNRELFQDILSVYEHDFDRYVRWIEDKKTLEVTGPDWETYLESEKEEIAQALRDEVSRIAEGGVEPLIEALEAPNDLVKILAAQHLATFGVEAVRAVPLLIKNLNHANLAVSLSALDALKEIKPAPLDVLPALYRMSEKQRTEIDKWKERKAEEEMWVHVAVWIGNLTWGLPNTIMGTVIILGQTIYALFYRDAAMIPSFKVSKSGNQLYVPLKNFPFTKGHKFSVGLFEFNTGGFFGYGSASAHEGGHAKQSMVLGPLYIPVVLIFYGFGEAQFIERWANGWAKWK